MERAGRLICMEYQVRISPMGDCRNAICKGSKDL